MLTVDEKRRLIRRLLDQAGRGFAEECGFPVTNNPTNLFALLYLSVLAAGRDYRRAAEMASAVREHWDTAAHLAAAQHDEVPDGLVELAMAVRDRYHGDLRRLRTEAGRRPDRERALLTALPGVTDAAADLFFREVQVLWPELAPFLDRQARSAATKLGLGRGADELRALTGDESEKFAWLAGALARVEQDGAHERVRSWARA